MLTRFEHLRRPAPLFRARKSPFAVLTLLNATWRQRKELSELDDDRLRDLGLTRKDAATEAKRPIWDVPALWTR